MATPQSSPSERIRLGVSSCLLGEEVRFDGAFSFVFSPRPRTGAQKHLREWGEVPREVAVERLVRLQALLREQSLALQAAHVGREVEVLVEGPSRYEPSRRAGRTPENRVVNFDGAAPAGEIVRVLVEDHSQGADGRVYSLRYVGALVADFHRILLRGGVFFYPGDARNPNGKLRLLYEAAPLAFLAEAAGGAATDG